MFERIAHLVVRRPRAVVVTWVLAAAAMLALALTGIGDGNLYDRAETGVPTVQGADSTFVYEYLQDAAPDDTGPELAFLVQGVDAAAPSAQDAVTVAAEAVAQTSGVGAVQTPYGIIPGPEADALPADAGSPGAAGGTNPLVASDGSSLLVLVVYAPFSADPLETHHAATQVFSDAYQGDGEVLVYSDPLLFDDFTTQIQGDLVKGEAVALPVALLVMVLVFGGFLAASAPLIGALASIAGGMAILFAFSYPITLDESAINVVNVLGIGLSIDYGLLVVSRYREELASRGDGTGHDARSDAMVATLATAGRTVFFSSVTVAISVGGMLVFGAELIRGIGGAALGVVVMALAAALTLVPAVLYLYGHRVARVSVLNRVPLLRTLLRRTADVQSEHGFFERLASGVQRRPWLVVGAVTAVLVVLASPLANIAVRNSQEELLPAANERRQFIEVFDAQYPALVEPQIQVVADAAPAELQTWLDRAAGLVGVVRATEPQSGEGGMSTAGIVTSYADQAGADATSLLRELRAIDVPFAVHLGGQAAIQVDFVDSLAQGAPWAIGLVVLATFVLLFLMTGSLLVPFKTLIINGLSLAASVGIVSWIFVDGNLEGLLDFTSTGGIETYVLVLIIAFGFGLAMDYEVFLLARIKELVDAGDSNDVAVRKGLQRSGRIITSAAAVIIIVFIGFATGSLLVIKEVGIGLAVAVFLDATLVRMLLVPATMTLLDDWNWWAPAPLRRLYSRKGISH
ncbi:MMPL family transporter [Demequina sp. TTPB684]|uniref:MMPL family transporter n=1 Tax=unclassified Demequina TaxID=2620311 RepID=UPI00351CCB53